MTKRKISFKIPPPLWSIFKQQTEGIYLNRAPFLDNVISRELPELRADLGEHRLSTRTKRYISGELKRQGAKSVNIEIKEETAAELNDAVRGHNLVRDAFMCRLIIFLRSSDSLLKYLEVPIETGDASGHCVLEKMPVSPMKAMEVVRGDPMYYVRHYIRDNWQCGIYRVGLPQKFDWAACYLEDNNVPGTKDYREDQKLLAQLFENLEEESLAQSPVCNKGDKK